MICGILTESNLEQVELEDEDGPMIHLTPNYYNYGPDQNYGKPWIDSGKKHGKDGAQLVLAGSIAERKKQDKTKDITEIPLDLMYKNPREVYKFKGSDVNAVLENIKEIERKSYKREGQIITQNAKNFEELAWAYRMNPQKIQVHTSADRDWYMIFEERKDQIYIGDLAAIGGIHSASMDKGDLIWQAKEAELSVLELMQKAGQEKKTVFVNATKDTSYKNIQKMVEKGLITVEKSETREANSPGEPEMIDMTLKVNLEKVTKELEDLKEKMTRRKERDYDR